MKHFLAATTMLLLSTGATHAVENDITPRGNSFGGTGAQASNCVYNPASPAHWCDGSGSGLNALSAGAGTDGDVICKGDGTNVLGTENGLQWAAANSTMSCWIYTGADPSWWGYVIVPTNQFVTISVPQTSYDFALCFVSLANAETMFAFAPSYALGDWSAINNAPQTTFFGWQMNSLQGPSLYQNAYLQILWMTGDQTNLAPYTVYGVHIQCPPKD